MPILWRYLLFGYLRIFFLSIFTFVSVLIVSRFKEIARFAALTADWGKTGLFILYQIPHIFPIALPISALIASILLFQKMSRSFELTALRASGRGLFSLLLPLLFTSILLSLFNFSFCIEISPFCRRESKTLLFQETSENPLLLLQRKNLVRLKNAYLQLQVKEDGKKANDLLIVALNEGHQRLSLFAAKELEIDGDRLLGKDVSILSHLQNSKEEGFDPFILENQSSMSTHAFVLSQALKKNRPKLETNALNLRMLRIRTQEGGKIGKAAYVEILRRVTLSISVFSLTLLGAVFGMEQGRVKTRKGGITALTLTLAVLVFYLLGKELKLHSELAAYVFLFPHPVIWLACSIQLWRISRGLW